ncbi:MAG: hypothetical protein GY805_39825 [Chloroflexi bacterium]|nr:hypothetical protein [Chloroflexota bacterium]
MSVFGQTAVGRLCLDGGFLGLAGRLVGVLVCLSPVHALLALPFRLYFIHLVDDDDFSIDMFLDFCLYCTWNWVAVRG